LLPIVATNIEKNSEGSRLVR